MEVDDPGWLLRASPRIKAMYAYWLSRCRAGAVPRRADIDPLDMPPDFLPFITIVEVVSDERRYVYRLVGTKDVELRGQDPTGKSVIGAYFGPSPESALACYDATVATGRPVYDDEPFVTPNGRYRDDENLFLPLSDDGHTINRIIVFGTVSPGPGP
jgi:hypothetical protein